MCDPALNITVSSILCIDELPDSTVNANLLLVASVCFELCTTY